MKRCYDLLLEEMGNAYPEFIIPLRNGKPLSGRRYSASSHTPFVSSPTAQWELQDEAPLVRSRSNPQLPSFSECFHRSSLQANLQPSGNEASSLYRWAPGVARRPSDGNIASFKPPAHDTTRRWSVSAVAFPDPRLASKQERLFLDAFSGWSVNEVLPATTRQQNRDSPAAIKHQVHVYANDLVNPFALLSSTSSDETIPGIQLPTASSGL